MPAVEWLRHYRRAWLGGDLVAALTTWALVVPQAIAYAQIAGLPPQAGLFAAFAGLLVYRLNAPLLFVNAKRLRDGIRAGVGEAATPVRVVLLDLSFTPELDIESVNVLGSLRSELEGQGVALWLAGVHAQVLDMLDRSGLADQVGRDRLYRDVEDAVADASA